MGNTGQDAVERRGRYPGVRNVLQGGGIGVADVRLIVGSNFDSNGEDSGGCAHRFTATDNGEAVELSHAKILHNVLDIMLAKINFCLDQ